MKIQSFCFALLALAAGLSPVWSRASTALIDEPFNYTVGGDLSTPWTVTYAGDGTAKGSTVQIQAADMHNNYTPTGNEMVVARPSGGNVPTATLSSGANSGTEALVLSTGARMVLTLEVSYASLVNTNGFTFSLRAGTGTFAGLRLYNTTAGGTTLQYMTTNSGSSFVDVASTTLSANTWYKLTLDVTISSATTRTMDVTLEQMGDGGGTVISATDLIATSSINIADPVMFSTGISGDNITYSMANIDLAAVPEPSKTALLLMSGAVFFTAAGMAGKRRV